MEKKEKKNIRYEEKGEMRRKGNYNQAINKGERKRGRKMKRNTEGDKREKEKEITNWKKRRR